MINDKQIDGLLGRLNSNLKSLEGTYSDFSKKCEGPDAKISELRVEISKKYEDIRDFVLELKKNVGIDAKVFVQLRDALVGCEEAMREMSSERQVSHLMKPVVKARNYVNELLKGALISIEQKFDNLLEVIINKRRLDIWYSKKLENQIERDEINQKADAKTEGVKEVASCRDCQRVRNESQIIIQRMNILAEKINSQAQNLTIPDFQRYSFENFNKSDSFPSIKAADRLTKEVGRLKIKLAELEKRETRRNSSMKIIEIQEKLIEKDKIINRQEKIIVENDIEKKNAIESSFQMKKKLEITIFELTEQVRRFEEENIENFKKLSEKITRLKALEHENSFLTIEKNELAASLEDALKNALKTEAKLLEKIQLSNKASKLQEQYKILQIDYENLKEAFKQTQIAITEKSAEAMKLKEIISSLTNQLKENESLISKLKSKKVTKEDSTSDLLRLENNRLKAQMAQHQKLAKALMESESQNKENSELIQDLEATISGLNAELSLLQGKNEELEEVNKELQDHTATSPPQDSPLPKESDSISAERIQKLEKDNESLIESQKFISDYINSLKDSYTEKITSLSKLLEESESKVSTLEESIEYQQYLYNKLQQDCKSSNGLITIRSMQRQKTSPANSLRVNPKAVESLRKLFETQSFDPNIAAMIGTELDEDDPNNFLAKIVQLKYERDSYYISAEKNEDLINELKESLNEEDEYSLLNCVVKLKEKVSLSSG